MTCAHCHADVPDGEFCARCGAHRVHGPDRLHHYALRPGEHVVNPSVISTLLPRLAHQQVHLFRFGLIAGVAIVAILAVTGLVIPAIWVAAFLVPAVYIAYLRGAEVFGREPASVMLSTVLAGGVLGVAVTAAADALGANLGAGGVLLLVCVVAIISEVVKPLFPLLVWRSRFPDTVDGLALGVTAGVGFAFAETLVNLLGGLGGTGLRIDPSNWVFTLFSAAVLIPLLHGSCTGLVSASLWRPHGGRDASLRAAGLPLAVIADVVFVAGSELLDDAGLSPLFVLLWQAAVVAAVLVSIRLVIHAATLDEAEAHGMHAVVCHGCGRHVEAAAFCPHCGTAVPGRAATVAVAVSP